MSGTREQLLHLILPPAFEYFPGLFMPDPARARLTARLALMTKRLRARGHGVFFDPGGEGYTAGAAALLYKEMGVRQVSLVGTRHDKTGISILLEALQREDIECSRPFITQNDGADLIPSLSNRIESLAKMDLLFQERGSTISHDTRTLMILEPGEPLPDRGIPFLREGERLKRLKPGNLGSIPGEVEEIVFFPVD
ncbi:MAG: hypothetical protein KJ645_08080, partial [Planctomycetes bacterium]|nr:hypothetical protein [Planctomycetota bacterium]